MSNLPRKLAATTTPTALSPEEIKKLYEEAVKKIQPSPATQPKSDMEMFSLPPGLEPSELEKALNELKVPGPEDRAMLDRVVKRTYIAIVQKDFEIFKRYFGKLRKVIEHYQPDSLTEEFLYFIADQEMWQWFDQFQKRSPTKEDQVYIYYLGEDLHYIANNGGVFK